MQTRVGPDVVIVTSSCGCDRLSKCTGCSGGDKGRKCKMMLLRQTELEETDHLRGKSDEMASLLRNGRGKKAKVPICHASSTERWCKRSATAWKLPAVGQYLRNCG